MGKTILRVIVAAAVTCTAATAWAYDIQNAEPMALGGAGRAFCPSNSSLYLNPAGLAVARLYHVETLYGYVPTWNGHVAGASVVDSVTAPIAMGLSFNYVALDPGGIDRSEYDVRISAAYYISRLLALGLSLKYLYANQDGHGELVTNLFTSNGEEFLNTVTIDVGATLTIGQWFSAAVVGYNLTNTGSTAAPLSLGVGLAVTIRSLLIAADMLMDFTTREDLTFRVMGGAEYLIADHWPIRLGYRWDQTLGAHSISGGLGYVAERYGIEISVRQDVSSEDDHLNTHIALGLQYYAN
jgi:opacity protein-like surface antigen